MFLVHDFYDYQEPDVIGEELVRSAMKTELRRLTFIPIGGALAPGVILVVSPIIDFKAGSFDFNRSAHMFDYHLPHPYMKYPYYVEDGISYFFAVLGQLACGFILSVIVGVGGFLFIHVSGNLILQMKILNNSLDKIESRIEAFNILKDSSSLPIGCSYLTGTIVIALSLVSAGSFGRIKYVEMLLSSWQLASLPHPNYFCGDNINCEAKELPGTTMASMILCAVEVGYMFFISVLGQRFINLSTELKYKMYNTRWYMCSKEIKSSLMIFQEMTLKPMILTVGKVIPANMKTFTSVMNGSYSYYNLVNALDKK